MHHDTFPRLSLHNVAAIDDAPWTAGGHRLLRVPGSVADELNVAARERVRHPTGCELRFVTTADGPVGVTLSAPTTERVRVFWGDFQTRSVFEVGTEPTTVEVTVPETLRRLDADALDARFEPQVCRLRFEGDAPVALHGVTGACRPPRDDEVPQRRYLAYGTSITEGEAATATHLGYVARTARHLGVDPLNLGCSGSAFCESGIADHVAGREDWDLASLSVSVNMANRGFTVERFRERAARLVGTVARAHPRKPVVAVTLFPYHADLVRGGDAERASAFRTALREVVAACSHGDLRTVEGPEAMAPTGLTADLLHPGDAGMATIAERVATAFERGPGREASTRTNDNG